MSNPALPGTPELPTQPIADALAPLSLANDPLPAFMVAVIDASAQALETFLTPRQTAQVLSWLEKAMSFGLDNWRLGPAFVATWVIILLMVPQVAGFHALVVDPASHSPVAHDVWSTR